MSDLATAAIDYARRGLPVFPLIPKTKRPACAHGKDDATVDLDRISAWWEANPRCNIGLRPLRGYVVLDVDPRSGGTLDALGALPQTRTAATGGGGWHLWFRHDGRVRGRLAGKTGVDIKTSSGYLVVPPSIHPSGGRYRWIDETPAAPLPRHLLDAVTPPVASVPANHVRNGGGSSSGLVQTVATATEGNRNHALFWAACRAVEGGADPAVFADLVQAAVSVGLAEVEAQRTVQSAMRKVAAA